MDKHDGIGSEADSNSIFLRYQALVDMSPEAIYVHDGHSISYVNKAAINLFGAESEAQLLGRSPYELFHPDNHILMKERIREAFAGHPVPFIENKVLRMDGSAVDVEIRGSSFIENGKSMMQVLLHDISERKAAAKLLQESEERYKSFFQSLPLSTVVFQAKENDFVIVDYNKASMAFTGNQMPQFLGKKASELYKSFPFILDMFFSVLNNKISQSTESFYRKVSTNEHIFLRLTLSFAAPDKIIVHSEDITERKQAEESLKESEERWRNLFNVMPSGVAVYDVIDDGKDFIFKDMNPAGERIDKVKRDEIIGKSLYEFFPNVDEMGLTEVFRRVWRTGVPENIPLTIYTDNKLTVWVTNYVWRRSTGELVALFDDITGQKQAEEAIKKSEKLYRAIGESIDYGVWVCEPDGRNIYASESFLKLVGITQEQCSKYGWGNVLHPDDAERTIAAWKECVRTEGHWDIEHRYKGVDGQWHPILARGIPVRDENGKIICWAGINLDISNIKNAEEDLRRHAAELTIANQGLEAFAHSVSHDLKTPLRAINSFSQIAKASIPAEQKDVHESLDFVINAAERMDKILNALMSLSKVVKQEARFNKFNLSDMAQSIIKDLKLHDSMRRVDCVIEDGLTIEADEQLIWNLMQNLIQNAWKFTAQKADACIEIGKIEKENSTFYFVRDNGAGFDMTYANKLFKPFQRLHSNKDYEGTGIGLTIVKRIIEKHGGTIHAESENDKGATFLQARITRSLLLYLFYVSLP